MSKRRALGGAIKAIREAKSIGDPRFRVSRFATEVQMSAAGLCNVESGHRQPAPETLERIALALGVRLDAISYEVAAVSVAA